MLFRRYGSSIHRVDPDFDPNAMNEISFRRDRAASFPSAELTVVYEKLREVAVRGERFTWMGDWLNCRLLQGPCREVSPNA